MTLLVPPVMSLNAHRLLPVDEVADVPIDTVKVWFDRVIDPLGIVSRSVPSASSMVKLNVRFVSVKSVTTDTDRISFR